MNFTKLITSPLGFFVFALLVVEAFLGISLYHLDGDDRLTVVWIGMGMFLVVFATVAFFVWHNPEHLTYDKESHLRDKGKPPFGTGDNADPSLLKPTNPQGKEP